DFDAVVRCIHNDFERSVFKSHPELKKIRNELLYSGCLSAFMTGSGATIAGIAPSRKKGEAICDKINHKAIIAESL
ncbi:MAG: 4-(cytidine 5'-diphospho)-2-C-methyl-D-erythritol kinase, partial [Chitinivibrionales bacterium]|nr:4-(cytidine 5'-diphospho)-2-C-methyl-D-erythritol kinase [Chitinivibrionales bacterium]